MTEQLQAKMKTIDNMTVDEIKAMTIFEFDEFAADISHSEARELLVHFHDRLFHLFKKLPSVDFGYADIEGIRCDYNVLDVTITRFFEDTLPALKKRCSEIPNGLKREISVAEEIYNTFSVSISEALDSFLDE